MNCRECQEELTRWLEQDWETADFEGPGPIVELPAALRAHGADCPACAARIEAVRKLSTSPLPAPAPPPYLTARIKARLDSAPGQRQLRRRRLWTPALGLAAALTITLILTLTPLLPFAPGRLGAPPGRQAGVLVHFTLKAPRAERVAVVGDWNGWDVRADPLKDPDGDGVWEAEIVLIPGREYRYQFSIDGRDWVPDPGAPLRIEDGFGGLNSILQL